METVTMDSSFYAKMKGLQEDLNKLRMEKEARKMAEHNRYSMDHGPMVKGCSLCGRLTCEQGRFCKEYLETPNVVRSWMIKERFPGVQGHHRCEYCNMPRVFSFRKADLDEQIKKYNEEKAKANSARV